MISFHWLLHISWAHICLNPRPLYFFCLKCSLPCLLQGFKHLLLRVTPTTLFKVAAFFPDTWLSILCFVFSSGKGLLFYPLWLIQHLGPCLALRILNEWEQSHWRTEGLLIDEGSEGSTWKDRYKKKKLHFYLKRQGTVGNQENSWYHHLHVDWSRSIPVCHLSYAFLFF